MRTFTSSSFLYCALLIKKELCAITDFLPLGEGNTGIESSSAKLHPHSHLFKISKQVHTKLLRLA